MKHLILAVLLALGPITALAHGTAPAAQHGGIVAETSDDHWVELVVTARSISVYVGDQANKPIPSARVNGKATVLIGGKSQQIILLPAAANSLTGQLDPAATGKVTAVLALTIDGKPSQARFTLTQP